MHFYPHMLRAFADLYETMDTGFQQVEDSLIALRDQMRELTRKLDRINRESEAFLAEMREKGWSG